MPATHLIQINRGAAKLLAGLLNQPGWYEDTATASRACAVLEMPELDQDPGERKDGSAEAKAWGAEPVEFTISERQRDAIKTCIEKLSKGGRIFLNRETGLLLRVFGFEPKDG